MGGLRECSRSHTAVQTVQRGNSAVAKIALGQEDAEACVQANGIHDSSILQRWGSLCQTIQQSKLFRISFATVHNESGLCMLGVVAPQIADDETHRAHASREAQPETFVGGKLHKCFFVFFFISSRLSLMGVQQSTGAFPPAVGAENVALELFCSP